jgi:hypothetical protein
MAVNEPDVNDALLAAQMQQAASAPVPGMEGLPIDPGAEVVQQATPEEVRKGYEVLFTGVVGWSANAFAPNWGVQPEETAALSTALADACAIWFPDQVLPPKYMVLIPILGVTAQIVSARRDPETGALRALRSPPVKEKAASNEAA